MKKVAAYAHPIKAAGLLAVVVLAGCTGFSPSVGISFPIGGMGSIGVSVGADGRVGGSVGVGVGGASVNVGTSGQLPLGHTTDLPAVQAGTSTDTSTTPGAKTDTPLPKPAQQAAQ